MLEFENVYGRITEGVSREVKDLWKRETVVPDADERVKQVAFIIRDGATKALAGVSTLAKRQVPFLNNKFLYEFRCYIAHNHRIAGLDVKLSKMTFDFIESIHKMDADGPVGIYTILENEELKKQTVWRRATWPELDMHLVGFTRSGNPIRVHYFKEARI